MDDLFGVGKVLDAKTTQKVYDDALSPTAKQVGKFGGDVAKAFHLFLAPFQLLAVAQDRFERWLDDVRSRVPVERQVEAPANIAGPVLMNLRFEDDNSILKDMYLNLLTAAIDKNRQGEAHPAYARIIEQMSPREADIFARLCSGGPVESKNICNDVHVIGGIAGARLGLEDDPSDIYIAIEHLEGLRILECETTKDEFSFEQSISIHIRVTEFGRRFSLTCLPAAEPTKPNSGGMK